MERWIGILCVPLALAACESHVAVSPEQEALRVAMTGNTDAETTTWTWTVGRPERPENAGTRIERMQARGWSPNWAMRTQAPVHIEEGTIFEIYEPPSEMYRWEDQRQRWLDAGYEVEPDPNDPYHFVVRRATDVVEERIVARTEVAVWEQSAVMCDGRICWGPIESLPDPVRRIHEVTFYYDADGRPIDLKVELREPEDTEADPGLTVAAGG